MHLIILPVIDSTNSYAQRMLEQGKAGDCTVILALEQSAGKGQRGKNWDSFAGQGLYASIILRPPGLLASQQFLLNKVMAVGLAKYIESKIGSRVSIKWPNDIIAENGKISGLLIENSLRGNHITAVITGVGVNLNQDSFSPTFETRAVSLKMITGNHYDPEKEVELLYKNIDEAYRQYLSGNYGILDKEYQERLFRKGEVAKFKKMDGDIFDAVLVNVDNNGSAILEKEGIRFTVTHPEVRFDMI